MDAPQCRNPPGGAGFESASHGRGLQSHLTTQRNGLAAPRDPRTVVGELHQAADRLGGIAEILATGPPDERALSAADALLIGCGRLITELRQARTVRP